MQQFILHIFSLKKLVCRSRCNNKMTTFMMNFLPSSCVCPSPKLLETEKYTIIFISNSPCLLYISISGFILIYLLIIIAYNLLRHMRHATLFGTIYYKIALAYFRRPSWNGSVVWLWITVEVQTAHGHWKSLSFNIQPTSCIIST